MRFHVGNGCRLITAAIFVVHLMVGCCAHHAHACDGGPHDAGTTVSHDFCGATASCGMAHDSHGPHGCQGAACTFIHSPYGFHLDKSSFRLNPIAVTPLAEETYSRLGVSPARGFFFDPAGEFLPPVRLHLLHETLLI
jgi:hypothetical protein